MFSTGSTTKLSEATDRLSAALEAPDCGDLQPSALRDLVGVGERIERLGHGLRTRAAARVADTEVWRSGGARSPEDWLAGATGTSKAEAGRLVETGRQLEQLPTTAGAVSRGDLSARQAEAIAGAATADPGSERRLLQAAGDKTLRELQDDCRRTRANADPDPEATAKRAHAKRSYRTWTDADGATGHIHLSGPVASIARIDNAIRHRADRIFGTARTEGRREPPDAYGFDAAEQAVTISGGGIETPKGSDAKIIVRIDHTALQRGRCVDGEVCEIAGVGPIDVGTVWDWMHDAFIAAVLTNGVDVHKVVHLGRKFTAHQRTALQWANPVCAVKGCSNRLGLEYDHIDDWAHTHTTTTKSGQRLCDPCHDRKTRGWHMTWPDLDGHITLTPPPETTPAELAASCRAAVAAQRQRARKPNPPPLSDTG